MRTLALLVSFSFLAPLALSQRGGGAHAGSAHIGSVHSASVGSAGSRRGPYGLTRSLQSRFGESRFGQFGFGRSRFDRYGFPYSSLAFPFFDDLGDSEDLYSTGYPVASAPPPFFSAMRTHRRDDDSAENDSDTRLPQPLMIEFQDGHYIHVSNPAISNEAETLDSSSPGSAHGPGPLSAAPPGTVGASGYLPPATLIFRDGHKEEVHDYAIANGTLYARGDYYLDGYWNKNIELSILNLPETLQANAANGVKFVLPSSPNEVVTRP